MAKKRRMSEDRLARSRCRASGEERVMASGSKGIRLVRQRVPGFQGLFSQKPQIPRPAQQWWGAVDGTAALRWRNMMKKPLQNTKS